MEFIHPIIEDNDIICVYQLLFDEKWFYIGSTCDLKNRIWAWQSAFNCIHKVNSYKKIKEILPNVSTVKLSIMKIMETTKKNMDNVRLEEKNEIVKNLNNPFLLNSTTHTLQSYTVHQVSHDEIIVFNSISDAAKYNNVCSQTIKNVLNSKCGYYKGYIFKYA